MVGRADAAVQQIAADPARRRARAGGQADRLWRRPAQPLPARPSPGDGQEAATAKPGPRARHPPKRSAIRRSAPRAAILGWLLLIPPTELRSCEQTSCRLDRETRRSALQIFRRSPSYVCALRLDRTRLIPDLAIHSQLNPPARAAVSSGAWRAAPAPPQQHHAGGSNAPTSTRAGARMRERPQQADGQRRERRAPRPAAGQRTPLSAPTCAALVLRHHRAARRWSACRCRCRTAARTPGVAPAAKARSRTTVRAGQRRLAAPAVNSACTSGRRSLMQQQPTQHLQRRCWRGTARWPRQGRALSRNRLTRCGGTRRRSRPSPTR